MSDARLEWKDIALFVARKRQSHEMGAHRAQRIVEFIKRELRCEDVSAELRGTNGPGPEYGSCSRFFVFFDESWHPMRGDREGRSYSLHISVSERAPLITSVGSKLQLEKQPWEGGQMWRASHPSEEASARAKDLALKIAAAFELTYVDTEWLRQIKLNPKELPWDDVLASLDIDVDEPTALNILFNEEM